MFCIKRIPDILTFIITAAILLSITIMPMISDIALPERAIRLSDTHLYADEDGPVLGHIDIDENSWRRLVPDMPLMPPHSATIRRGISWHRLEFTIPHGSDTGELALYLGRIGDADETYLNGSFIGRTGVIGDWFVEANMSHRLYRLPPAVVHEGRNVITVRLLNTSPIALFIDEPFVAAYPDMTDFAMRKVTITAFSEAAFATIAAVILLVYGYLYVYGGKKASNLFLLSFTACYGLSFLFGSSVFDLLWHKTATIQLIDLMCEQVLPILLILFVSYFCFDRIPLSGRLLVMLSVMPVVPFVFAPPLRALDLGHVFATSTKGLTAVYYVWLAGTAMMDRRPDSVPLFIGIVLYVIGSRLEYFWGLALRDQATGMLLLCMLYSLSARHTRLKDMLTQVRGKLLRAQEDERRRIARDLHDGVGQSLQAIRLRLQMFNASAGERRRNIDDVIPQVIGETSSVIEDIRRISLDLRPSFLENMSLADSVVWYAADFERKTSIATNVTIEGDLQPVSHFVHDNLFRILQEVLANTARHAGASTVDIRLVASPEMMTLTMRDDGSGFQPGETRMSRRGIGLSSMEERATIIGGTCVVQSAPGKGTTVEIRVPREEL